MAIHKQCPLVPTEVQKDPEGRYLFVKGKIQGQCYTIATIYAPNSQTVKFLIKTLDRLEKFREGLLILGGDFNITMDPSLDTSSGKTFLSQKALRCVKKRLRSLHLVDSWRVLHERDRDYSYFSKTHNMYSRIDMLMIDQYYLSLVDFATIESITISDHAPISLGMRPALVGSRERTWRLNEAILDDKQNVESLTGKLTSYFEMNTSEEVSDQVVWEAHKAVMRGELISMGSRIKRDRQKELTTLLEEIHKIEIKHKTHLKPGDAQNLEKLRADLKQLLDRKTQNKNRYFAHRFYEQGNKSGRLMARQLKKQQEARHVHTIKVGSKQIVDSQAIAAEFHRFYTSLYNLDPSVGEADGGGQEEGIREYLKASGLQAIPTAALEEMEKPISIEELERVILEAAQGKSPGPDGFTNTYYKKFSSIILTPLCRYLNSVSILSPLSPDALTAYVTVLPKAGKDPQCCASYRPISLLNSDVKFLSKILALRLQDHIVKLIHPDQTGFMKGREARDNTIRALHVLHWIHKGPNQTPAVVISMDAEKAFDRVGWGFMVGVLREMGLRERMMGWVMALYAEPRARVKVNGRLSDYFEIKNGTRQGCPLSPLLFAMVLEPFLCMIRGNRGIKGIVIGSMEHKISAYADDLLLYLSSPQESLTELMREIDRFGCISNFKINIEKSMLMPNQLPAGMKNKLQRSFPFVWRSDSIFYLGTHIAPDVKRLYELNYIPLLSSILRDLQRWRSYTLTWFGRVSALKMSIIPRLIYVLYAIPIALPQIFFKQIKKAFRTFVWGDKHPRLAYDILKRSKKEGGVGLPDMVLYYRAMALVRIMNWRHDSKGKIWVSLEKTLAGRDLAGAPWIPTVYRGLSEYVSPLTTTTLSIWDRMNKSGKFAPPISPITPLEGFPWFPPGEEKGSFEGWGGNCSEVAPFGELLPLRELVQKQGEVSMREWKYRQLTDLFNKWKHQIRSVNTMTTFEEWCVNRLEPGHMLSRMHRMVQSAQDKTIPYYMREWERELGLKFTAEQSNRLMEITHRSSISSYIQEMSYKFLTRWYHTPTRLAQIYPLMNANCWRGCNQRGSFLHIWWQCPRIRRFWEEISPWIKKLTLRPIEQSPLHFLFHGMPASIKFYKRSVTPHLLNAAKALIPRYWKQPKVPNIVEWKIEVERIMEAERWVYMVKDQQDKFKDIWAGWIYYSPEVGKD